MFGRAMKLVADSGLLPRYNPAIVEGVGYIQAKDGIHDKVAAIFRRELTYSAEDNPRLPVGLAFIGCRIMSPLEGLMYNIDRNDGRSGRQRPSTVSVAPSDTYMVSVKFRIPGKPVPLCRQLALPYIRRGGLFTYNSTDYQASAVLHQPGICREQDGAFINFGFSRKVRLKFCKNPVKMTINGQHATLYLPGTPNLYTVKNPQGGDTDDKPLAYWLFGKYGFTGAIRKYCGVECRIVPIEEVPNIDVEKEAVVMLADASKYAQKLITYALAVPADALPSLHQKSWTQKEHVLLALLGSFYKAAMFYASRSVRNLKNNRANAGNLPPLFSNTIPERSGVEIANLDSADCWQEILGRSVRGTRVTDIEIVNSCNRHFNTECPRYVDDQFRGELMLNDPDIDPNMDLFDFMFYAIGNMLASRLTHHTDLASMYGKRLTVVDYMLLIQGGFTPTISSLRWKLEALEGREIQGRAIDDLLNQQIVVNMVLRDVYSQGAFAHHAAATESMVLGGSTHAISQTETDKRQRGNRGKGINVNDRTKHSSASHLECGNVYYIPKSSPLKYAILNPYAVTDQWLVLQRNPKLAKYIAEAEDDISRIGR